MCRGGGRVARREQGGPRSRPATSRRERSSHGHDRARAHVGLGFGYAARRSDGAGRRVLQRAVWYAGRDADATRRRSSRVCVPRAGERSRRRAHRPDGRRRLQRNERRRAHRSHGRGYPQLSSGPARVDGAAHARALHPRERLSAAVGGRCRADPRSGDIRRGGAGAREVLERGTRRASQHTCALLWQVRDATGRGRIPSTRRGGGARVRRRSRRRGRRDRPPLGGLATGTCVGARGR